MAAAVLAGACLGNIDGAMTAAPKTGTAAAPERPGLPERSGGAGGASAAPLPASEAVYFASALRRLTRAELRQTVLDLTGVDLSAEVVKLPEDYAEANDVFAFDNKYGLQQPSNALVEASKHLADTVAARVLAEPAVQQRLVPCRPGGPADAACLRTFVSTFGRRALRRPLAPEEVNDYVARFQPFAVETGDFFRAVALVTRVMLQDMEFLYRVEVGTPVRGAPGVSKLGPHEMATRLSYFLWGTTPDEGVLQAAETGDRLQTPASVRTAASRMLADPRARLGIGRFHAMWLGYERQPPPAPLTKPMLDETQALIDRVILRERRSWLDLFRSRESYVDRALAAHYGLPPPAQQAGWVPYGDSGRQGILSHGTFLGVERKHEDTSPTMRGHFVRMRLLCQHIPEPPPDVDTDNVPRTGNCKADRYSMWKMAGCQGCHLMMDPIGHGLENYDRVGRARTLAPDDRGQPGCEISGVGDLVGAGAASGPFRGIAGLSDKLVESGALEACLATQLAHYYLGREVRDAEKPLFEAVAGRFRDGGHRFDQMLLDFVALPGFGYRQAE